MHLNVVLQLLITGGVFLLQGILQGCNSMCAGYLFQPDKQYDVNYDTGDKAIQCGRHVDIFKFWLMWKAKVGHTAAVMPSQINSYIVLFTIHMLHRK